MDVIYAESLAGGELLQRETRQSHLSRSVTFTLTKLVSLSDVLEWRDQECLQKSVEKSTLQQHLPDLQLLKIS